VLADLQAAAGVQAAAQQPAELQPAAQAPQAPPAADIQEAVQLLLGLQAERKLQELQHAQILLGLSQEG
jgi:hypothetical protein